jgi:hypothetical protein
MSAELDYVKRVAKILKQRFPNLTVEETIDLAGEIVDVVGLSG